MPLKVKGNTLANYPIHPLFLRDFLVMLLKHGGVSKEQLNIGLAQVKEETRETSHRFIRNDPNLFQNVEAFVQAFVRMVAEEDSSLFKERRRDRGEMRKEALSKLSTDEQEDLALYLLLREEAYPEVQQRGQAAFDRLTKHEQLLFTTFAPEELVSKPENFEEKRAQALAKLSDEERAILGLTDKPNTPQLTDEEKALLGLN